MALRFVHCSDIHLLDLEGVGAHRFFNKRATGAVNLALHRRKAYAGHLFDRIVEHAVELKADRLVVTGDVTNLALEVEFELVRRKFGEAGLPVTVIPGNHDAYTRGAARTRRFESYLSAFMEGDRQSGHDYPFVQRFGGVALIGLSTAIATLPLYATGRLGDGQLARLDAILKNLGEARVARVVLIHHPVIPGVAKARHDLLDLDAFMKVIARRGAELILHGHEHVHIEGDLPGPEGAAVVHGIASGTALSQKPGRHGAFSLYTVAPGSIAREHYTWNGEHFVGGPETSH